MTILKNITIEKATIFISVLGLFMSVILSELNRKANIELEEKKIESTLFLEAIQVNNKQSTIDNLKFLLKMGAISKEREEAIKSLTDSAYVDSTNQVFTKSDTVDFFDFQIMNNKKDKTFYYRTIRGANIKISSIDRGAKFELSQYTDNNGRAEFYFPKSFEKYFIKVTIIKNGYLAKSFEMKLPSFNGAKHQQTVILRENE